MRSLMALVLVLGVLTAALPAQAGGTERVATDPDILVKDCETRASDLVDERQPGGPAVMTSFYYGKFLTECLEDTLRVHIRDLFPTGRSYSVKQLDADLTTIKSRVLRVSGSALEKSELCVPDWCMDGSVPTLIRNDYIETLKVLLRTVVLAHDRLVRNR